MKTKELIRQLQEADPTGELQCVVGGTDIHFVDAEPGYYDGPYEVLLRDETVAHFNIIGARLTTEGEKVRIRTLSIEDLIWDNPELPVEYACHYTGDYGKEHRREFEARLEKIKADAHRIRNDIERDHFVAYMASKGVDVTHAKEFYDVGMSYDDAMPEHIARVQDSWNNRREMQWDGQLTVADGLIVKRQ